jgi:hypothetical protein
VVVAALAGVLLRETNRAWAVPQSPDRRSSRMWPLPPRSDGRRPAGPSRQPRLDERG